MQVQATCYWCRLHVIWNYITDVSIISNWTDIYVATLLYLRTRFNVQLLGTHSLSRVKQKTARNRLFGFPLTLTTSPCLVALIIILGIVLLMSVSLCIAACAMEHVALDSSGHLYRMQFPQWPQRAADSCQPHTRKWWKISGYVQNRILL